MPIPRRHALVAGFLTVLAAAVHVVAIPSGQTPPAVGGAGPAIMPGVQLVPLSTVGGAAQPRLSVTTAGDAVLSWLEPGAVPDVTRLRTATLAREAQAWNALRTVAEGANWFVNWADVPSVVPVTDRAWAAHWLEKSDPATPYAYDVRVVLSHDGGRTWSAPITPHDDGTKTEHGFVSFFAWPSAGAAGQDVGLVWLDGRAMAKTDGPAHGAHAGGDMALRVARLGADGSRHDEQVLDARVCECCPTAALSLPGGALIAYRNRGDDETRDTHVVRWADGWERDRVAVADRWVIAACPVNGPALATNGAEVALAWFTAEGDRPRVQVTFSTDRGATWSAGTAVDLGRPLGRIGLAAHPEGGAVVTWIEAETSGATVRLRRVATDGALGAPHIVAQVASSRLSGYPRIVASGESFLLAWVEGERAESRVVTARVPVSAVP